MTAFSMTSAQMIIALLVFFVIMYLIQRYGISVKNQTGDDYIVSTRRVGFGLGSGSMIATWIWAASMYSAAIAGYTYGISGPIHYGLWGALCLFFVWPYGRRLRSLAPLGHTLPEVVEARHGTSSHVVVAFSNVLGSTISLMANLTAAGALISIFSPLSFFAGVALVTIIILGYTLRSGFRSSVLTDFVQMIAIFLVAIVAVPLILNNLGGVTAIAGNIQNITPAQANIFSFEAFMFQGAPMLIAILSWAIANQTVIQRMFAIKEEFIPKAFILSTFGYGSVVIGVGTLGFMALVMGIEPMGGDVNNIVPQMAAEFLPPVLAMFFMVLILSALCSTSDSELSALASISMTDFWHKYIAKGDAVKSLKMILVGRVTMIFFAAFAVILATLQVSILTAIMILGAIWGATVFPIVASLYWEKVNNLAFTLGLLSGLIISVLVNLGAINMSTIHGSIVIVIAIIGAGVVIALLAFPYLGKAIAVVLGVITVVGMLPFIAQLGQYQLLIGALSAYGASTIVCFSISYFSKDKFEFSTLSTKVKEISGDIGF